MEAWWSKIMSDASRLCRTMEHISEHLTSKFSHASFDGFEDMCVDGQAFSAAL